MLVFKFSYISKTFPLMILHLNQLSVSVFLLLDVNASHESFDEWWRYKSIKLKHNINNSTLYRRWSEWNAKTFTKAFGISLHLYFSHALELVSRVCKLKYVKHKSRNITNSPNLAPIPVCVSILFHFLTICRLSDVRNVILMIIDIETRLWWSEKTEERCKNAMAKRAGRTVTWKLLGRFSLSPNRYLHD